MVGDHNQLSPFDAAQRQKFYDSEPAAELLRDAKKQLETISDLPPEVNAALDSVISNELLRKEVLATAARLEEPFRSIAEREVEREKETGRPSTIVNTLLEQSRMHRDIEMEFEECASLSLRQLPFAPHRTRRRESDGMCQFSASRYGTAWFDSPSCWLGP
jgi:hypothetical protein